MILGRRSVPPSRLPALQLICELGISDGVLNPSGVRFGSGEIYTVLEEFSKTIDDSLCIGQRRAHDKDERVLLFLKMRSGHRATPKLLDEIQAAIRKSLSARHVPAYIFEIEDIPVSSPLRLYCLFSPFRVFTETPLFSF